MTTLLCMGFSDAAAIRKALRLAKNDINEAVALLTNERPGLHYGGYEPMESGQGPPPGHGSPAGGQGSRDGDGGGGGGGSGGFDPPPAYHEVVETEVSCGSAPSPPPTPAFSPLGAPPHGRPCPALSAAGMAARWGHPVCPPAFEECGAALGSLSSPVSLCIRSVCFLGTVCSVRGEVWAGCCFG